MSYRSGPDKSITTLQNKVFDGGVATDSSIIILPKNTTTGLAEIQSELGLLAYDTTQNEVVVDKGSGFEVLAGGGGGASGSYTPADSSAWLGADPTTIQQALDRIADFIKGNFSAIP